MGVLLVEERTYTAASGVVIGMKPISAVLIAMIDADITGKPQVPIIEVSIAGSAKRAVENPDDPAYKASLDEYQNAKGMRMMRFVFSQGTVVEADPAWVEATAPFFADNRPSVMRVNWLFSVLTFEEAQELMEGIISLTTPTEKGLALATDQFPSNH